MLQCQKLWCRLLTSLLRGGHNRAVCQPTLEVETYRRGDDVVAASCAIALPSRWAGAARGDFVALLRGRDGFENSGRPAHEPTTGRALPGQGSGTGRTRGAARPAGARPTSDLDRLGTGLGGGAGLSKAQGVGVRAGVVDDEPVGPTRPQAWWGRRPCEFAALGARHGFQDSARAGRAAAQDRVLSGAPRRRV